MPRCRKYSQKSHKIIENLNKVLCTNWHFYALFLTFKYGPLLFFFWPALAVNLASSFHYFHVVAAFPAHHSASWFTFTLGGYLAQGQAGCSI